MFYDIVLAMRKPPSGALKLVEAVASPSRSLLLFTKTAENSGRTASVWLFFRPPNRRRPRISAGNEMSMADNLLQKTAKTANRAMRCLHHPLVFACYECVRNEPRPRSVGGLGTG